LQCAPSFSKHGYRYQERWNTLRRHSIRVWQFGHAAQQFYGRGAYGPNWFGYPTSLTFDTTGQYLWSSDETVTDFYRIDATNGQLINDYYPSSNAKVTAIVADSSGNVYGCPVVNKILQFNGSSNSSIAESGRTCDGP
jgi:hypothetical protein